MNTTRHTILNRWTNAVLFECDVPEGTASGLRTRHALVQAVAERVHLHGANLHSADLHEFKADVFDILLRAPNEVAALRAALVAGKVDGSVYEGECACLIGTIANARGVSHFDLGDGISPNSSRPAEQWFMQIHEGYTPETNRGSAEAVAWIDEFVGLLAAAKAAELEQ